MLKHIFVIYAVAWVITISMIILGRLVWSIPSEKRWLNKVAELFKFPSTPGMLIWMFLEDESLFAQTIAVIFCPVVFIFSVFIFCCLMSLKDRP